MPSVKPTETISALVSRAEFPIFTAHPTLVYLDSAATSQKPATVIDAEAAFYRTANANVHRGLYSLAQTATDQYEAVRSQLARFIGAAPDEIVFTKGTAEAINLVAQSFVRPRLKRGMQIITTVAEHHSNFVPWQQLAKEKRATLTVIPVDDQGNLDLMVLETALNAQPTALVAIADVGNVLGTINPTKKIVELAHKHGVPVLVDAAQSLAHIPVSVARLDADFLVGSAHKLYGPTGVGFLYAKRELLEAMPPYQLGGDMIRSVTLEKTTWNDTPYKFEAGTPNMAGVVAFGAALEFITNFGWDAIADHEEAILAYLDAKLRAIDDITVFGPADPGNRAGAMSFVINGVPPHDLATILDEQGIAIRAGFHCAEPLHRALGLTNGSARASVGVYTSSEDIDRLIEGIRHAQEVLKS